VTISPSSQNLAIISTSTVILPTLVEFEGWIRAGSLDRFLDNRDPAEGW
jgi:hypothetical protein